MDRGAVAPADYAREARERAREVNGRLDRDGRDVLEQAAVEAREADDDHVGTEHVLLAIVGVSSSAAAVALSRVGITRDLLVRQRHDEEGPSPTGPVPRTPRADRIIALAGEIAHGRNGRLVNSAHLLLGAVAESEEWAMSGCSGPHHLLAAAEAVGGSLADVRAAVDANDA